MKKMYWSVFVGMVIMGGVIGYNQAQTEKKAKQAKAATQLLVQADSEYSRGFMDGLHSALGHIQFDTNKGKFQLEIYDVLNEMKLSSETNRLYTNSSTNGIFDMRQATNFQPRP